MIRFDQLGEHLKESAGERRAVRAFFMQRRHGKTIGEQGCRPEFTAFTPVMNDHTSAKRLACRRCCRGLSLMIQQLQFLSKADVAAVDGGQHKHRAAAPQPITKGLSLPRLPARCVVDHDAG